MTFIDNYESLLFWLMMVSIVGFMASLVLIPWIMLQLPADYFLHEKRKKHLMKKWNNQPLFFIVIISLLKNIVGILLISSGMIMLFTPGQGILTLIMGIILTDMPYKYKIEQWIIKKTKILHLINRLRKKAKKDPFILEVPKVTKHL